MPRTRQDHVDGHDHHGSPRARRGSELRERRRDRGARRELGRRPGRLFVVEADESDGSFLLYDTSVALVTNVDPDHLDHYGSLDAFEQAFVDFADRARELVVISSDDAGATRVRERLSHRRVVTFGHAPDAAVRVHSITTDGPVAFTISYDGAEYRGPAPHPRTAQRDQRRGAFAVLVGLGFDPAASLAGIARFAGTGRRFELHGKVGGVSVYDDYAHHPTEVAAALSAARTVVGSGRIIAVRQPHLYSRTRLFAKEFAEVLERYADETVVLDVYGAREDPEPGVTGALVSERFADASKVAFMPDWQEAADHTARIARAGRLRDHPRLRRRLPHRAAAARLARAGARMRARRA